jgi:hypothetical protein
VVFSHGWPLSADAFEDQMFFLAARSYRCLANLGGSAAPPGDVKIHSVAPILFSASRDRDHGRSDDCSIHLANARICIAGEDTRRYIS